MQIPHEVSARPDTGLYNAKLGIWLFLASEVMLFGGLFSAYLFLRLGSDPGYWSKGFLNIPVGTLNTFILIASSILVVLAWASLKMRRWNQYWWFMLGTLICGVVFLTIKLSYEWPAKFVHFGVYVNKESAGKYEEWLGNKFLESKGAEARYEITGDLVEMEIDRGGQAEKIDLEENAKTGQGPRKPSEAQDILTQPGVKLVSYTVQVDQTNAEPASEENLKAHFMQRPLSEKKATIKAEDVVSAGAFFPRHNTFFAAYFLITGLHGLHVVGGLIVFGYMFLFGKSLYLRNPEHMANRIEVAGLYWHFVDLVWLFVFPIFYLL